MVGEVKEDMLQVGEIEDMLQVGEVEDDMFQVEEMLQVVG